MSQPRRLSLWSRLDDQSRLIVLGFLVRVALGLPLLVIASEPAIAIHQYAILSVVMSGVLAIMLRHPINGRQFTLWDDMLWFSAISYVAQMASRV